MVLGYIGEGIKVVYRSCLNSLGAAHWDVQCMRWKTSVLVSFVLSDMSNGSEWSLTLLNAVLISLAVLLVLASDALSALVVVVLERSACGGLFAL